MRFAYILAVFVMIMSGVLASLHRPKREVDIRFTGKHIKFLQLAGRTILDYHLKDGLDLAQKTKHTLIVVILKTGEKGKKLFLDHLESLLLEKIKKKNCFEKNNGERKQRTCKSTNPYYFCTIQMHELAPSSFLVEFHNDGNKCRLSNRGSIRFGVGKTTTDSFIVNHLHWSKMYDEKPCEIN